MTSLYEIRHDYQDALNELSEIEDLNEQIIEDSLSVIKGDLVEKGRNVAAFIKNAQASADAIKEAAKTMSGRASTAQNKIDRLKAYLIHRPNFTEILI